jgi:hypothetical protein
MQGQHDLRKSYPAHPQDVREFGVWQGAGEPDVELADKTLGCSPRNDLHPSSLGERAARFLKNGVTGFGDPDLVFRSVEQRHTQFGLQLANLSA